MEVQDQQNTIGETNSSQEGKQMWPTFYVKEITIVPQDICHTIITSWPTFSLQIGLPSPNLQSYFSEEKLCPQHSNWPNLDWKSLITKLTERLIVLSFLIQQKCFTETINIQTKVSPYCNTNVFKAFIQMSSFPLCHTTKMLKHPKVNQYLIPTLI